MSYFRQLLQDGIYLLPAILISLTVHEFCHAYAAHLLGDPTAKQQGRLSLNPLAHLDPLGTLCLLLFRFGWAKPVPVGVLYFKNPKRDMALTAAAGPLSNLTMAFFSMLCYYLLAFLMVRPGAVDIFFSKFFNMMIFINIGLAVFNMLPISPLDGSKIFAAVLPERFYFLLLNIEQYIRPLLFVLLYLGVLTRPLVFLQTRVINLMQGIILPLLSLLFGR